MGWLEGLLTGYADEQNEIRKDEALRAEKQATREADVMKMMLNSEDPEIKGMAATGLITNSRGQKRKGGFGGWMGEMEANPIYPKLMKYIGNRGTALPDPLPPGQPPLAQSTSSPTEGQPTMATPEAAPQPPPKPPAPYDKIDFTGAEAPPRPPGFSFNPVEQEPRPRPGVSFIHPGEEAQFTGQPVEDAPLSFSMDETVSPPPPPPEPPPPPPPQMAAAPQPRALPNIFPTNEDVAMQQARGRARGDVQGDVAGYAEMFMAADPTLTPEQANKKASDLVMAEKLKAGRAGQTRAVSGQTLGPDGRPTLAYRIFDPGRQMFIDQATGQPDPNFKPVAGVGLGPYVEQAAIEANIPRGSMIPPAMMPAVLARAHELQQEASYSTGMGTRQAEFNAPQTIKDSQATGTPVGTSSAQYAGQQVAAPASPKNIEDFKFYQRGKSAEDQLTTKDQSGTTLEDRIAQQNFAKQLQGASWFPNVMQTEDQRRYRQAQLAFSEARLRDDSGAVINTSEFANDQRTYFAVPGDTPAMIKTKAAMRKKVLDGLAFGSGSAYTQFYGQPFVPPLSTPPPVPPARTPAAAPAAAPGQPQAAAPAAAPIAAPPGTPPGTPPAAVYGKNPNGQTTIIFTQP